jgi:hypothetical protein
VLGVPWSINSHTVNLFGDQKAFIFVDFQCNIVMSPVRTMQGRKRHKSDAWVIPSVVNQPVNTPDELFLVGKHLTTWIMGTLSRHLFNEKQ